MWEHIWHEQILPEEKNTLVSNCHTNQKKRTQQAPGPPPHKRTKLTKETHDKPEDMKLAPGKTIQTQKGIKRKAERAAQHEPPYKIDNKINDGTNTNKKIEHGERNHRTHMAQTETHHNETHSETNFGRKQLVFFDERGKHWQETEETEKQKKRRVTSY